MMRGNLSLLHDRLRDGAGQLAAFGFAAVLSGALFVVRWNSDVNWDGVVYLQSAQEFAAGRYAEAVAAYSKFPAYSLLIACLQPVLADWVVTGKVISLACMVLAVLPLYRLTRDLFGEPAAFWASLAFALLPDTLLHATLVIRDPPFFLLFLWAVYFAQKTLATRRTAHLLTTLSAVVASALFRAEGLILLPLFVGTIGVLSVRQRPDRAEHAKLLRSCAAAALVAIVLATVALIFSEGLSSRVAAWSRSFDEYLRIDPLGSYRRIAADLQHMDEAAPHSAIGQHFAGTARRFIPVIFLLGTLQMAVKVLLPINLIPLLWGLKRSHWDLRHSLVFGTALVLLGILYAFFFWYDFILSRYFYLPVVLLCPWVGAGIAKILEYLRWLRFGGLGAAAVVVALVVVPALSFDKHFKKTDDLAARAGVWIAGQAGFRGMTAVFSDPVVAFYAGRAIRFHGGGDAVWYPDIDDRSFARIERFAAEQNAGLIVLSLRSEKRISLAPLQRYQVVREFARDGREVIVYRSVDPPNPARSPSNAS
jgi:4-amino-4-deoxy-L-arabinose transferase-like glycosyltransferase